MSFHFQMVDWVNMCVDSHFAHLVLTKEFHPFFVILQDLVKQQVGLVSAMHSTNHATIFVT
jgi:hypothetical protein